MCQNPALLKIMTSSMVHYRSDIKTYSKLVIMPGPNNRRRSSSLTKSSRYSRMKTPAWHHQCTRISTYPLHGPNDLHLTSKRQKKEGEERRQQGSLLNVNIIELIS